MGKTYKDNSKYNPTTKPKNKGSQKNKRAKVKEIKEEDNGAD